MTNFAKDRFFNDGDYLLYKREDGLGGYTFVARFKRTRRDRAGFKKFLIQNFSVEEYFAAREAGETPVGILETKGYVSKTVADILKNNGFEPTLEGRKAYIKTRHAAA